MKKYIEVTKLENDKYKRYYYEVNDFNPETIKQLPFYTEEFAAFALWEGSKRTFTDQTSDIFPGDCKQVVFNGAKITCKAFYDMFNSNLKYKSIIDTIRIEAFNLYSRDNIDYEKIKDFSYDEKVGHMLSTGKMDERYFVLFQNPDVFSMLKIENNITLEEFDETKKSDKTNVLLESLNSFNHKEYFEKNKSKIELLYDFIIFLFKNRGRFNNNETLFSTFLFDVRILGLSDLEELKLFFNTMKYIYTSDVSFIEEYESFLIAYWKEYFQDEDFKLD